MIDYREDPETKIVEIVVDGPIDKARYDEVCDRMVAFIEAQGSLRLLEVVRSLGKIDLSIIPADISFAFHHLKDITHCAVVSEKAWIEWLTKALDPLMKCKLRYFESDEIDEARAWLRDPD